MVYFFDSMEVYIPGFTVVNQNHSMLVFISWKLIHDYLSYNSYFWNY